MSGYAVDEFGLLFMFCLATLTLSAQLRSAIFALKHAGQSPRIKTRQ